jgi:phage-related protein
VTEKPLAWLGSSLDDVRAFPAEARRAAGYQLGRVQQGLMPDDWKPMTTVGAGVHEIRIHTALEHRVFYVAKYEDAVYVIHAFEKRTPKPERPTSPWRASASPISSDSEGKRRRRLDDRQSSTLHR